MSEQRTAILAHGKNWEVPVPVNPRDIEPSIESKMTAEAAGVLYTRGIGDMIILSGGRTAGPEYPSEAAAMLSSMYQHFSEDEIPPSAIKLEQVSHDTTSNLKEVKNHLVEYDIDSLVLLTIGYHLPRVKRLARILDVPVSDAFKSDEVISERYGGVNHLYARTVLKRMIGQRSVRPLVRTVTAYGLEAAGWGVSIVDPTDRHLGKMATTKLRHKE